MCVSLLSICLLIKSHSSLSACLSAVISCFLSQPTCFTFCHFCLSVSFAHTLTPAAHKAISPPTCFLVQKSSASSSDLKAPVLQRETEGYTHTQSGRDVMSLSLLHTVTSKAPKLLSNKLAGLIGARKLVQTSKVIFSCYCYQCYKPTLFLSD